MKYIISFPRQSNRSTWINLLARHLVFVARSPLSEHQGTLYQPIVARDIGTLPQQVAEGILYDPQEELSLLEEYMFFIAEFHKRFRFSS